MATQHATAKLELFSGGVPPLSLLMLSISQIRRLSRSDSQDTFDNPAAELCLIGLAAYFEAFCKGQFAAIVNILPQTLLGFTALRDCNVPVRNLLYDLDNVGSKLGFVVAEEYDFGTAKYINSLFTDLLKLTPFSKTIWPATRNS